MNGLLWARRAAFGALDQFFRLPIWLARPTGPGNTSKKQSLCSMLDEVGEFFSISFAPIKLDEQVSMPVSYRRPARPFCERGADKLIQSWCARTGSNMRASAIAR
jgi:hypothetical protein